jgi:hypothetical protein
MQKKQLVATKMDSEPIREQSIIYNNETNKRQGNALSVTLFNLAFDYIIKKSDIRGNI